MNQRNRMDIATMAFAVSDSHGIYNTYAQQIQQGRIMTYSDYKTTYAQAQDYGYIERYGDAIANNDIRTYAEALRG